MSNKQEDRSCPPNRNPFVGRILTIVFSKSVVYTPYLGIPQNDEITFWNNCFQVLEKYGHHVFHLNFFIDELSKKKVGVNPPLGIWNTVVQVLSRVPNLKSVQFDTIDKYEKNDWVIPNSAPSPLPPTLRNLESLSIPKPWLQDGLVNPILTAFGNQLRKLEMPVKHWREGMGHLFTNLTELDVNWNLGDDEEQERAIMLKLRPSPIELLHSVIAPNLVKLQVSYCPRQVKEIGVESDLLKWLRKFPALRYLNIGGPHNNLDLYEENSSKASPIEKFPSLEYLCIRDSGKLSFNFLRSFPSLRKLKIDFYEIPLVTDLSIPDTQIKLREQLQTWKIYDSNIWEHLPNLRIIVLWQQRQRMPHRFSRDQYEMEKQSRGGKSEVNCGDFNKFQHLTFYTMLRNNKKEGLDYNRDSLCFYRPEGPRVRK